MCGICGIYNLEIDKPVQSGDLELMLSAMVHRGPDDGGFHTAHNAGIGARRLSIIDIEGGSQPIFNEDRSMAVVSNGEIYNFRKLTKLLEKKGHKFKTSCDTEVLVHLYEEFGANMLEKLNGIFAFAIFDFKKRELFIARDRAGVKPLYYFQTEGRFLFSSEIKSLLYLDDVPREPDYAALDMLLRFMWIPEPRTGFAGIRRLEAGGSITLRPGGHPAKRFYWDFQPAPSRHTSIDEAAEELQALVATAVKRQLVSDVPVGAYLSGGLDSCAIANYMQAAGGENYSYYTAFWAEDDAKIDFQPRDVDFARRFSKNRNFNTTEIELSTDSLNEIANIVWYMEQPSGVPAIVPGFLISRAAAQKSTVLMSGMGADELFAGYPRHAAMKLSPFLAMLPAQFRKKAVEPLLRHLPTYASEKFGRNLRNAKRTIPFLDEPFHSRYIDFFSHLPGGLRRSLYTPESLARLESCDSGANFYSAFYRDTFNDDLNSLLFVDFKVYLAGDNLLYTDKMGMANSVEIRVPFLDNEIIEFAASLPASYKLCGLTGKAVLKRAMQGVLPDEIVGRKKAGFTAPVRAWMHKERMGALKTLLSDEAVQKRGLLNPSAVKRLLNEDLSGREDYAIPLWSLIMLEVWFKTFIDRPRSEIKKPLTLTEALA